MRPIQRVATFSERPPPAVGDASDLKNADDHDGRAILFRHEPAGLEQFRSLIASHRLERHLERRPPGVLPLADREQRTACRKADNEAHGEQRTPPGVERADREDR